MFKINWTNSKADKAAIILCIAFIIWYYDFVNKPDLEKFNLKEQLPAPQNEAVIKEITQLILSEPGNYLKYYVGYIEFLELKAHAKTPPPGKSSVMAPCVTCLIIQK